MRGLLQRRGFRTLLVGQGVSALGDWMGTVALMALVLQLTNSSTAVAGVLVLRLAPAAVAGPLAARIANHTDRRTTMLTMDLTRAVMIALVPLVAAVWWVYMWAFLLEAASIVFLPARDASIPDLVEPDQLEMSNSLVLGSSYGSIPLGAGLFALVALLSSGLVGRLELAPVFWIDAATFLFSFAMIRRIRLHTDGHHRTEHEDAAGFARAFRIPLVRAVVVPTVSAAVGVGVLFSLGIVFVHDTLGASNAQFAVLVVLFGLGAALGLVMLQRTDASDLAAVHVAVAVQGATIAVMSLAPTIEVTDLGALLFGASAAAALAAGMGVVQRGLVGEDRVLAFTAFHVLIRVGLSVAAIGAGIAADLLGGVVWPVVGSLEPTRVVLLCSGLLVLAGSAAFGRLRHDEIDLRRLGDDPCS